MIVRASRDLTMNLGRISHEIQLDEERRGCGADKLCLDCCCARPGRHHGLRIPAPATDVKKADSAEIAVRLTDKRTGKAIPGAVIFAQRIDMAPDSMEGMTSSIAEMPSIEPGVYRFKVNLTMAGGWRLSLGAKVQGETGTLESRLTFKAVP
jgi:hypothetical protein